MKKFLQTGLIILYFVGISIVSIAQSGNALDFDGVDDYVSVNDFSYLLANSEIPSITMGGWAKCENTNISWPDFAGLFGLRNDIDCDFYLLLTSSTQIEGRYTDYDGNTYTITEDISDIDISEWNHYALVYSYGFETLYLYVNGIVRQEISVGASFIINEDVDFQIGNITYDTYDFYFDGQIDEVFVCTYYTSSIEYIMNEGIESYYYGADLVYYKFDESSGTTLPNVSFDDYNGTLYNMNDDDWVNSIQTYPDLQPYLINSDGFIWNDIIILTNSTDNDVLNMQDTPLTTDDDVYVSFAFSNMGEQETDIPFLSWIYIDDQPVLFKETTLYSDQIMIYHNEPLISNISVGQHTIKLVVDASNVIFETDETNNEYSRIFTVTQGTNIKNITDSDFFVYPNPATEKVHITSSIPLNNATMQIYSISGQLVLTTKINNNNEIDISNLSKGIYTIKINSENINLVKKIIIE